MFSFFRKLFGEKQSSLSETDTTVKYLIAGLGNIGSEYNGTRHNIGFDVVDYLAGKFDVQYKSDRHAFVGSFRHKGRTFILIKPTTYMNLSGQAIRYWMQKEKIKQENLLVILDDLNIGFGHVKLKTKGSAGGHNGLKNIEQVLKSAQYSRLRVGIGNQYSKGKQVNFVLGKWTDAEEDKLMEIIKHSAEAVLSFGTIGVARTMNLYNKNLNAPPKKKKAPPKNNNEETTKDEA